MTAPEAPFTPRKEFLRQHPHALNAFSLLAISSSNSIRLYSFPPPLIQALRRLFERNSLVQSFREDFTQGLCEFSLDGKPWASPKSVASEVLLVDILSLVYQFGYSYLSTIDYGREHDDRLAMAFSKPVIPLTASPTSSTIPDTASAEMLNVKRTPFALSFVSATLLRVVAPPLHSTPAILQAVRGSWPRGVVSEKKVGVNSFEFKLKGYRWFQEDNFAADSLRHILSLLSSLDTHAFSLQTSISLTNRSRVKDLWIFTGPASLSGDDLALQDSPASVFHSPSKSVNRMHSPEPPMYNQLSPGQSPQTVYDRKLANEVMAQRPLPSTSQHSRVVSDDVRQLSNTLRKPAPRAQVPISVIHEAEREIEVGRIDLASTISNSEENMTGVGTAGYTPEVFYSTSPFGSREGAGAVSPTHISATVPRPSSTNSSPHGPFQPSSARTHTPPLVTSHTPSPPPSLRAEQDQYIPAPPLQVINHVSVSSGSRTPPLLGPGVFRDSAFSSTTEASCEIPIKWTGMESHMQNLDQAHDKSAMKRPAVEHRVSTGPMLPGGWQPSPIEEKYEGDDDVQGNIPIELTLEQDMRPEWPLHEVGSRFTSPELSRPEMGLRKSEAAVQGIMSSAAPSPPIPSPPISSPSPRMPSSPSLELKKKERRNSGQGWVLVNVEGRNQPTFAETESEGSRGGNGHDNRPTAAGGAQSPMSATVKAIVILDAVDAKKHKSKQSKDSKGSVLSGPKRLFSLSRKNSVSSLDVAPSSSSLHLDEADISADGLQTKEAQHSVGEEERTEDSTRAKPRSGFRNKLRRMGAPEASRSADRRVSID